MIRAAFELRGRIGQALSLLLVLLPAVGTAAPVSEADSVTMHRGGKARIEVLANDQGTIDPATVSIAQPPQYGTVQADASGRIVYTHTTGTPTGDSFTYRVSGSGGQSNPATVTIQFATGLRVAPAGIHVPPEPPPERYQLKPAFGGVTFDYPVSVASPPGDTKRAFVCEHQGRIRMIPDVTAASPMAVTFLDLKAVLVARGNESLDPGPYSEHGLLSLTFHPNYAQNGYFYVFYTAHKVPNGAYYERVSRFQVQAGNPNLADPDSELVLIEQQDDAGNHDGGDIHFGPDGYLYFSAGDEGNEQLDPYENSQRIDKDFFSGIFRIDVDKRPASLAPNSHAAVPRDGGVARYAIPPDNPFVGTTTFNGLPVVPAAVRTEFWATGLRNPWRFSFDSATGELWCGDVGHISYEEINHITRGGNYGWIYRDGSQQGFRTPPVGATFTAIDPIYEYRHNHDPGDPKFKGNSVIGGVFYHGSRLAALGGAYICGDCVSGNIWALRRNGGTVSAEWLVALPVLCAFGSDPSNGDVLVAEFQPNLPLRKLTGAAPPAGTYPQTLSETGLFADTAALAPNPGLLPYEPNVSFWSDNADKRRWFAMPDATSVLGWAADAAWALPDGALWVKHFDLETTRGNPATKQRIETRVLVKNSAGVYGVSYQWNAAQTDATLVPAEGADLPLAVTENGTPRTQIWRIPSRGECLSCHNAGAGYALSFNTRQLNRAGIITGFPGNQIDLLRLGGYLSNSPPSSNVLPRHVRPGETEFSLEARARSYLAVNCSQCHRPGGGPQNTWDARAERTLVQTLLVNGIPANNGGNSANKLIVPGDAAHSVLLHRLAATNGFTRMPPLATNEVDAAGHTLLTQWITASLPSRQSYEQWRLAKFGSADSTEGERSGDPDHDGRDNEDEFLLNSNPLSGYPPAMPVPHLTGDSLTLEFDLPPDRAFQIEVSSDLTHWSPWDVPGNNWGAPPGGPVSMTGPASEARQLFRFRLQEP